MGLALLIEAYLMYALSIVVGIIAIWALADCVRHQAARYTQEGKRTKGWWMALTGGATIISVLTVISGPASSGGFLQLISACVACVYLADVKPAVSGQSGNWYN
ncbi:MAG TPA: DUF2516 domain-containing protein [Micrococcaceae bacterium]|jgi:uncharacterized membrane protein HdeD (DUF308 family)|nr:DUF2516 domain-containing protein [Micrococcaceae bacterium]